MEENKQEEKSTETNLDAKSKFSPMLMAGLGIVVVVIIGAFFLFRGQGQTPSPTQTSQTQEVPAITGSEVEEMVVEENGDAMEEEGAMMEAREIVVEGSEFSFSPKSISVKTGEKVKLTFNNTGSFPHNLTVEGLGIATRTIGGGESNTVEFTVEEGGTYATFCSVGNHRVQGMEGTLEVE